MIIKLIATTFLKYKVCKQCEILYKSKHETCSIVCQRKYKYKIYRKRRRKRLKEQKIAKKFKKQTDVIYKDKPKNMTVDHIIPLFGENVSGLHVPWNLQYLSYSDNLKKGNNV